MSNIDNALAALGGDAPAPASEPVSAPVSADLPTAQVPEDVQRLAREAASAHDIFKELKVRLDDAKDRALGLADDLKDAMVEQNIAAVPLADRDDITISTVASKKGKPQATMKGILATMEERHERIFREQWAAIPDLDEEPDDEAIAKARKEGKTIGQELWKELPRPMSLERKVVVIPEPHEVDD